MPVMWPDTIKIAPMSQSAMFVTGPARAIRPNWAVVVLPRTMTAPGAMKTMPVNAERMRPNLSPDGSALNSAQQPYLFAMNLCAIS